MTPGSRDSFADDSRGDGVYRFLHALEDKTRFDVYRIVQSADTALTRSEVAAPLSISPALAGYHLERLVVDELIMVDPDPPTNPGTTGKKARTRGRPPKRYRAWSDQLEISIPARDYGLVGEVLARAGEAVQDESFLEALEEAATEVGEQIGHSIANRDDAGLIDVLRSRGFDPYPDGDLIRLRNCPFDRLARDHTELVCGLALSLVEGLLSGTGDTAHTPEHQVIPGHCCVVLHVHNQSNDSEM